MKSTKFYCLAVVSLELLAFSQNASAQLPYTQPATTPNPYSRPAYSPFLNLLRPGDPAINYYGLVRPQQQFRAGLFQSQVQNASLQQSVSSLEQTQGVLITGNRGTFLNYSRYFLNNGVSGAPLSRPSSLASATVGTAGRTPGGSSQIQSFGSTGRTATPRR
jgi:hypothetical protein